MSLFKWSTPERREADLILPIIPNEIYISIFEYIAPPTARLAPKELEIFANLAHVCRFFANFCLPHIFEFVEFSGGISPKRYYTRDANHKASREATLCTQIAAKQPLALSLAKRVRICHFTDWALDDAGSWAVQLFVKKYIAGMSHMKNIRELKFSASFVDAEHWNVIATLESLEELSFDSCRFLQGPADIEPEKRVKVKVSRLRVVNCSDRVWQPNAAIDPQYLRILAMDSTLCVHIDWLTQSALTELHFFWEPIDLEYIHAILTHAPKSVEALWLSVDIRTEEVQGMVRSIFEDPAWRDLPLLRSLTLQVLRHYAEIPANVLFFVLDCVTLLPDLQSFILKGSIIALNISSTEVPCILHEKVGPSCRLKYVDICGDTFRLVDGEWLEVSCSTS